MLKLNGPEAVGSENSSVQNKWEVLTLFGEIQRQSKDRVAIVRFNKSRNLLACQVVGKIVDILRVLDEAEFKRKDKRRIYWKEKKFVKEATDVNGVNPSTGEESSIPTLIVSNVFKLLHILRASKKICSISLCTVTPKSSLASLALYLNNNLLEIYSIESGSSTKTLTIELQGHRYDLRSVTLSSYNTLLMSTIHNAVKFWNPSTGSCLSIIDYGYGLCGLILPCNKYALFGTKGRTIEIIDIGSGTCIDVVKAHGGFVWSIAIILDGDGFVTGSEDHEVEFWEYQYTQQRDQVGSLFF